jgi:signal transduction histidine kinase
MPSHKIAVPPWCLHLSQKAVRALFVASSLRPIAAALLAATIFVADTATDLEIAVAVFYVAVVLMSVSFCQRRGVLLVSAGCMVLTLLSYFLTPGGAPQAGLINCLISLSAIGATTYLVLQIGAAQAAAQAARMQLAHIARVTTLGELTISIAHEVNQPLAAVATNGNACLRWLASDPPNLLEVKQSVTRIVEDAHRASEVVRRVRKLAKREPPHRTLLNINDVVLEIVALMQNELQRHRITLRTHLSPDAMPILADRIQLHQVILNLILNSVEALDSINDAPRDLVVSSENDETRGVVVTVRDTGIGFEPGQQDHLFDAFYTTKANGMGMGLAITRSIIEAHDGRIGATPNSPRGTTVQFTLPASTQEAP